MTIFSVVFEFDDWAAHARYQAAMESDSEWQELFARRRAIHSRTDAATGDRSAAMNDRHRVVDREVTLNGLRLVYRDWAGRRDDAPALLLLHGATSHAWAMDPVAEAMTDRYRVLAPHQRGHGESEWSSAGEYDQRHFTADLEAFVSSLRLERFALVGYSLGGFAGYSFAGRRPAGLQQLVIVDSGVDAPPTTESLRDWLIKRAQTAWESVDDAVTNMLRGMPGGDEASVRHTVSHGLRQRDDGRWVSRFDPAVFDIVSDPPDENWALPGEIAVPTLLIRGGDSQVLAADIAERMVRTIPDCSFVEFEGATHGLNLEQPRRFIATVRDFLD